MAIIDGAPNPEPARRLVDYLLRPEIEARLAASKSRQIPLRTSVPVPAGGLRLSDLEPTEVTLQDAAQALPVALRAALEILE